MRFAPWVLVVLVFCARAEAQFVSRYTASVRGDITMTGNAILSCRDGSRAPSGLACEDARRATTGSARNNDYPMDFVDADGSSDAEARRTFSSSTADLTVPSTAGVLWAGLYWYCETPSEDGDPAPVRTALEDVVDTNDVLFRVPGSATYEPIAAPLAAPAIPSDGAFYAVRSSGVVTRFLAMRDVTDRVRAAGNGTYAVANIQCTNSTDLRAETERAGGWALVVAYGDQAAPLRNLAVNDALRFWDSAGATLSLSSFLTPRTAPVRTHVGIVAFDGDRGEDDWLDLRCTAPASTAVRLSSAVNPAMDISNSTISLFGASIDRAPNHPNTLGVDIDIFGVTDALPTSCGAAEILGDTALEAVRVGVLTFATDIFAPELSATKTASVVGGGPVAEGATLEYLIDVTNQGNDPAVSIVLRDVIPGGTTFVPGSIRV